MRRWFVILLIVTFSIAATLSGAEAEPRHVLLLDSYGPDFRPFEYYVAQFRRELVQQFKEPVDFDEQYLASARYPEGTSERPFTEYLQALFDRHSLDLIVAFGAPAALFVEQNRQKLFPTVPMLITGTEQRRVDPAGLTDSDSVVAIALDVPALFDNIIRVLPETKQVALVFGNSPNEKFWTEEFRRSLQRFSDRLQFIWLDALPFSAMQQRVAALPKNSAILFGLMSVDAADQSYDEADAFRKIRAVANAPLFTYVDSYFGQGAVGGPLVTVSDVSRQAADVATSILRGEKVRDVRKVIGLSAPRYDARELQRWNISEAALPPGSSVEFRVPTMWQQYRWPLIAIIAVVLFEAMLIAGLLFERFRRRQAESESRNRILEARHMNRIAAAGRLTADVAHELNQPLGAILSNVETAELLLSAERPDLPQLKEIMDDIHRDDQRAADIIRRIRELVRKGTTLELRVLNFKDVIDEAVHLLAPSAKRRSVTLSIDQFQRDLSVRADPVLLEQVIINLVLNAIDAIPIDTRSERTVSLRTAPLGNAEVMVSVSDTGPGIPDDKLESVFEQFYTTKPNGTGLGLSIARGIIARYGGKMWAESRPERGAVVRFTLPLVKAEAA
jgi:signal transduction histidine kinase